jgi:hypothetical protein
MGRKKQLTPEVFKKRIIILVAAWLILLIASLSSVSLLLAMFQQNPQVQSLSNVIWGGYVVADDFTSPTPQVTGVSASWTVPKVNVSVEGYSSVWIGIGGQINDTTLIQMGTAQNSVDGKEEYSAWFEMLPKTASSIHTVHVHSGDRITAVINLVNPQLNLWSFEMTDHSNGNYFYQEVTYASSKLTAEWIVERPTVKGQISTLADFGTITFTSASARLNQNNGVLGDFHYTHLTMTDDVNNHLVTVLPVVNKDSFTVSYLPVR